MYSRINTLKFECFTSKFLHFIFSSGFFNLKTLICIISIQFCCKFLKVLFDPFECKGGYARNFKEHAEYLYMGYPLLVTLITKRTYYVFNSLSKIVWYGTNWVLGYFMSHYLYVSPPWKHIEGGLEGLTKDQP